MARPKIYKPSIYNGPTLYNGDGSVYNGNGVYKDGVNIGPHDGDFIFYTDFSNYDVDSKIDYPLIGEYGQYNGSFFYPQVLSTTGGPFNKRYARIYNYYDFPTMLKNYEFAQIENCITFEFWTRQVSTYNSSYVSGSGAGSVFTLSNKLCLQVGSGYNIQLYNGAAWHTPNLILTTPDNVSSFIHVASVVKKGVFYLFTNGLLRAVATKEDISPGHIFRLTGTGSIGLTDYAYLSVRVGDMSNNDQSFNVPTEPYM